MKRASILDEIMFKEGRPAIAVLMETDFTKEIRIAFKAGQIMKDHQTAFPIVVEIVDGEIDFGVENKIVNLKKGDLVSLEASVPHKLLAKQESIVRLTLSKSDQAERVKKVAGQ